MENINVLFIAGFGPIVREASARIPGPTNFRRHRRGLSLTLTMSKRRLSSSNRKGIECS